MRYLAVRPDGQALFLGRDVEGGVFHPEGGGFVRTMTLPDGPLVAPAPTESWHHQYGVAWHTDGRPTAVGTRVGTTSLQIQVGGEFFRLSTGYAAAPRIAYRRGELLIARSTPDEYEIAGVTFTRDEVGGFLVGVDGETFEASWAQGLVRGFSRYRPVVMESGVIALVAHDPIDRRERSMHLTFYR